MPAHLAPQLSEWLTETLEGTSDPDGAAKYLALRLHIELDTYYPPIGQVVGACLDDEELFLDCVEGALRFQQRMGTASQPARSLDALLKLSGSKYKLSDNSQHLVDAVEPTVEATRAAATSVTDEATEELSEAWAKAYGRSPDPSDAWDHAIKAVEVMLRPVVEPHNNKATLGSMIAVLNNSPSKWVCVFPGGNDDNAVENLIATLRLIWPNTDRHGGGGRAPTLQEARAVVTLSATIVQWHREGTVLSKR
ncbi:hypothetical protein V6K52_01830 [Knoellia sp. S7-12]|uniref:hypothetical protein n=1 Tax=Knoellia sp. S7-12 TaxID=3126698 RepID=UPI0033699268